MDEKTTAHKFSNCRYIKPGGSMTTPNTPFQQLIADEWEFRLNADPIFATYTGDHRFDAKLPRVNEQEWSRQLEAGRVFQRRLNSIDRSTLALNEQLNYDIFRRLIEDNLRELEFGGYYFPIAKVGGVHTSFPDLAAYTRLESATDYENFIARIAGFEKYIQEYIALMRAGVKKGFVPPRVTLEGVDESIKTHLVEDATDSALYEAFKQMPASISGADQDRLRGKASTAILQSLVPGFFALGKFLSEEYLPAARESVGADDLPNGRAFYEHRIRTATTLPLTADAIHQTGQAEVKRIRAEMMSIVEKTGFGSDFAGFLEFLRSDERFYAKTAEQLLEKTALILKRMDGELPRLFKTLPRTPYGIRVIPDYSAPGNTTAYYFPPAGDGTRAGYYYVNTYDLKSRPTYEIEALSLHEAVPGHHLQIALQMELDIPNFRRYAGFTAYVEGWALYSERLGLETGFYTDPFSDFGRLSYEMWRACRLVVDTGMHALGWSRQQAIDFMAANTSSTLLNITNEIDRYIAWPGQALAYKIGELKIRELRAYAEKELGAKFNLREFHDVLLTSGAVPLDVLENMVKEWVKRQ
jgi:uncharacterized protein (DUF885 family)